MVTANVDVIFGQEPVKVSTLHHDQTQPKESRHFLLINNPKPNDSGDYVCIAKNDEGEAITKCCVTVTEVQQVTETQVLSNPKLPLQPRPIGQELVPESVSPVPKELKQLEEERFPSPADTFQSFEESNPTPPVPAPKPENLYEQKTITRIEESNVVRYEGAPAGMEPPRFDELTVDHTVEEGHLLQLKCHVTGKSTSRSVAKFRQVLTSITK